MDIPHEPTSANRAWSDETLVNPHFGSVDGSAPPLYDAQITPTLSNIIPMLYTGGPSSFEVQGELDAIQRPRFVSLDFDRAELDQYFPLAKSRSLSNDAKEVAKERRRTQNRFAQRAYRQRKEQAIKDQEREIEALKSQLAKEQKLNQALTRVIDFLKERLKSKQPPRQDFAQGQPKQ